ncbi:nucleoside 2-deoxyribosyltransferase [Paenibacillus gyeongsangnamensis]|uniref:nucleoside 2-deoxyribosyltransferase n=1 Tax=Paenibacillus gyeongsangnamensis TaxID=3388067 RepID=UPI00390808A1
MRDAGFEPFRVNQSETTGKICDEIISQIRRSKFVVADFTGQRNGVYFEAGFAMGLGIPVIWICNKQEIAEGKLHFDTRQYNHIDWETEDELYTRLLNRIKANIV